MHYERSLEAVIDLFESDSEVAEVSSDDSASAAVVVVVVAVIGVDRLKSPTEK